MVAPKLVRVRDIVPLESLKSFGFCSSAIVMLRDRDGWVTTKRDGERRERREDES